MTVKDRVGRVRYIAFELRRGQPVPRPVLSGALPETVKLTRFDGTYGIVRTGHRDRDAVVAFLTGLARLGDRDVEVVTLTTSGTIRAAARALPASSSASQRTRPPRAKERPPAGPRRS